METANHLLKDGGIFLLHTITGHDEVVSEPWIRKYIFPGGTLPSLRELVSHAYDADFRVLDVESLRRHYYRTLMCWYHNFLKVHDVVAGWKNVGSLSRGMCGGVLHRVHRYPPGADDEGQQQ